MGRGVVAGAAVAIVTGVILSAPLLLWPVSMAMAPDRRYLPGPPEPPLVVALAVLIALAGPGAGLVLCLRGALAGRMFFRRDGRARPARRHGCEVGIGLVAGWAGLAVVTSGWCTGLAGDLHHPERRYRPFVDRFHPGPPRSAEWRARAVLAEAVAHRGAGDRLAAAPPGTDGPRPGGCWEYVRGRGLVEPPGAGTLEYGQVIETADPAALDRIATELSRVHSAIGRLHEAAFETSDGASIRLTYFRGGHAVLVTVRSPCLRTLAG